MTKYLLAGVSLTLAAVASAGDLDRLPGDSASYYRAIVPVESEMRWKGIPWMTRLDEAMKVGKAEKRPVFIWVVDNEPLDRC
jgi:hypothetical protein